MLKQLEAETGIALSGAKFHKGKGCVKCWNSGYRGRTGVFELLEMNDAVRDVVVRGGSAAEVRQAATETGMVSILQDGLEKAKEGTTTIEEVLRVLA
jgi:type II secretory ATPase GspE/PulE/Tfp pilus assembly ATPase PilB-like protein